MITRIRPLSQTARAGYAVRHSSSLPKPWYRNHSSSEPLPRSQPLVRTSGKERSTTPERPTFVRSGFLAPRNVRQDEPEELEGMSDMSDDLVERLFARVEAEAGLGRSVDGMTGETNTGGVRDMRSGREKEDVGGVSRLREERAGDKATPRTIYPRRPRPTISFNNWPGTPNWRHVDPTHLSPISRKVRFIGADHQAVFTRAYENNRILGTVTCRGFRLAAADLRGLDIRPPLPFSTTKYQDDGIKYIPCLIVSKKDISKIAVERSVCRSKFKSALDHVVNRSNGDAPLSDQLVYITHVSGEIYHMKFEEICEQVEQAILGLAKRVATFDPSRRKGKRR